MAKSIPLRIPRQVHRLLPARCSGQVCPSCNFTTDPRIAPTGSWGALLHPCACDASTHECWRGRCAQGPARQTGTQVCTFAKEHPMSVSTSQRAKGLQRLTDFTSRLNTLYWLPILLIRLIEGIVFVDSGWRKLFLDLKGYGNFFVELGIPFPYVMALVVAIIEFGGGICLILGLGTRVVAFAEAVIMANAIWMVQVKDVKSFSELLFLSEFLSIGIFVWLVFTGAGKISLDYWLVRKLRGAAQSR